MAKQVY